VRARSIRPGTPAYDNHIPRLRHPSVSGYKDVLRTLESRPNWTGQAAVANHGAGRAIPSSFRAFITTTSTTGTPLYQPWNSSKYGAESRDLIGEWSKAARASGMRYGVAFPSRVHMVVVPARLSAATPPTQGPARALRAPPAR